MNESIDQEFAPSPVQMLQEMFVQSQWRPHQENLELQQENIQKILNYAYSNVPFYHKYYNEHFGKNRPREFTANDIHFIPVLTRKLIQAAEKDFISQNIPAEHGNTYALETSGSTGQAVKTLGTDLTQLFYDALLLREHAWHKRNVKKKLLAIRWLPRDYGMAPNGISFPTWGSPIDNYRITGPSVLINIASSTQSQCDALLMHKPNYVVTYPSQAAALAIFSLEHQLDFSSFLESVCLTGEMLTDSYRDIIHRAWPGIKLTDIYSCVEIGNIAQQCTEQANYHVNIEHVHVEIVDEQNQPCAIGQIGKILLTSLANYATPLVRYEIGDYAAWGDACACGRSLPVIQKIFGRKRNRLMLPTGESRFPYLGEREERSKITTALRQFQFIQHTLHDIEVKVVMTETITNQQETALKEFYQKNLGYPFNIKITYHEHIPAGPRGKYEEFISRF